MTLPLTGGAALTVRGNATPEELAAVTALLAVRHAGTAEDVTWRARRLAALARRPRHGEIEPAAQR